MTFADRVVRMRKASIPEVKEEHGDPETIASQNVEILADRETQDISWPRASGLYKACMRMHVIGTKLQKQKVMWGSFKSKLIYSIGNALHYWVQNEPDLLGNRRRGWWRCLACGKIRYFGAPPATNCRNCGAKPQAAVYHEHWLRLKKPYFVTGHPDMFFEKAKGLFRVVEVKSMEGDAFAKLLAPLVEHVWQSQTYMWACSIDPNMPVKVDAAVGYVLYIAKKNPAKKLPLKMFTINREDAVLLRIKKKLRSYKTGLVDYPKNVPEPIDECNRADFGNYRAKVCPCRDECLKLLGDKK